MQVNECVILAAGKGSRLDPITRYRPKHLLPLAGRPLLVWQLKFLAHVGIRRVVVVKHHLGNLIERVVRSACKELRLDAEFIDQGKPLGTAHALGVVEGHVKPPFLMTYGDVTFTPGVIKDIIESLRHNPAPEAVMIAIRVRDPWNYGVLKLEEDKLVDLVEKPRKGEEPSNLINSGIYLFRSERIFDFIRETKVSPRGELELTDSLKMMAKEHYVRVIPYEGKWWFDVGRSWDLLMANRFFFLFGDEERERYYRIGGRISMTPPVYIGRDVIVEDEVQLGPYTVLCDGVKVGRGATVMNSILLEGSEIGARAKVSDSIIGSGAVIGEGTVIYSSWSDGGSVWTRVKGKLMDSGCSRLGAIVGDGSIIGRGAILVPGVVIMPNKVIEDGTLVIEDIL